MTAEIEIIKIWFSIANHGNSDLVYSNSDVNNVFPAGIYLLKVNKRNNRTRCETCSKLTITAPEPNLASFWCLYC